jgi:hypothetical protein
MASARFSADSSARTMEPSRSTRRALPGATDHVVVDASHSGLLFSAEAADQAVGFLRHGRFAHAAGDNAG